MSRNEIFHVLLVGNYRLDQQMSMLRYFDMLLHELFARNVAVTTIEPEAYLGKFTLGRWTKWLRYIDKYLIFPFVLRRRISSLARKDGKLIVHITDHSNALYLNYLPHSKAIVTCHDLLAVRGALGEDTDCPASRFGKLLQTKILAGLQKASHVICVSQATRNDLTRLAPQTASSVILLPLNQPYGILTDAQIRGRLDSVYPELLTKPYILHLGSSLTRKNREGILRIFAKLGPGFDGLLVFAGECLHVGQKNLADKLGISHRIVEIESPSSELIEALYNQAYAFLFPSKTEGFGWPIIEAQACGCPVLVARTTSLPQVVGEGGLVRDLEDEAGFAEDLLALKNENFRQTLIAKGLANLTRFQASSIIDGYLARYKHAIAES